MSRRFPAPQARECFSGKWLANLGADNEFGPAFAQHKGLLNEGGAINFALRNPTQTHYLDPTFCLHNEAILWIMRGEIANGLHPVPQKYDELAVQEWTLHWPQEDIRDLDD